MNGTTLTRAHPAISATPPRQQGFALITVLLISLIISLLAIAFSQQARQWVQRAEIMEARVQAELLAYSGLSQTLFTLNSHPRTASRVQVADEQGWNLYGEPFALNESTTLRLQDTAGLIALHPYPDTQLLSALMARLEIDPKRIAHISDSLQDWIDTDNLRRLQGAEAMDYRALDRPGPRNAPLQLQQELSLVMGMDDSLYRQLEPHITFYHAGHFNPMAAPEEILAALIGPQRASQITALRQQGLARHPIEFLRLSRVQESAGIMLLSSSLVRVHLEATHGEARATRTALLRLREEADRPYGIWEWH